MATAQFGEQKQYTYNVDKSGTPYGNPINSPKTLSVTKYTDNPDGTTTNYLSDGSTSTVRYSQNKDGSLQPFEVSTINQNNLAPVIPATLPNATIIDNSGIKGAINGAVSGAKIENQYQTEQQKREAELAKTKSSSDELLKQLVGENNAEADANNIDRTQENNTRKQADKITSEIEQLQRETDKKIEEARKTFGGTTGGLNDEIQRIQREASSLQADKALTLSALTRDYATMNSIAEQQVQNNLAKIRAKQENLKLYISKLDKDEARQYSAIEKQVDREYEEQKTLQNDIKDLKLQALQNEAPASVITALSNAKTFDEAIKAAGKYGTDYLSNAIKKASLSKTNAEIDKIRADIKSTNTAIDTSSLPNTTNGVATKLMASAKNDKQLDATERQALSKARNVINQLDSLESNISKQNKTGWLKGKVGNFLEGFGLDTDVGVINAQLQAITPNLARGVYGEVGVLTDNDIKLYRTTLPRLDRPEDQNDAILALTLRTVAKSIENTLTGAANSGIDVSGWTQDYLAINKQIYDIEDRIGVSKEAVNEITKNSPDMLPAIKEMYSKGFSDGDILEALNAR